MKKQVALVVANVAFLNKTAAMPDTEIFVSEDGGLYLVSCCQEVTDTANDNVTSVLKYSDEFQDFQIDLNTAPGPLATLAIKVKAGGSIVIFTNNVNISSGQHYNLFVALQEL